MSKYIAEIIGQFLKTVIAGISYILILLSSLYPPHPLLLVTQLKGSAESNNLIFARNVIGSTIWESISWFPTPGRTIYVEFMRVHFVVIPLKK